MPRTPKHIEVFNTIKDAILSGRLEHGERLYNESWLCDTLHVSRATLRRAFAELVEAGYLEHRINKGFYVAHSVPFTGADPLLAVSEHVEATGGTPSSQIHYFSRREAGERYAGIFGIAPDDYVIEIHRQLLVNDEAFCVNHLFLAEWAFPDFNPWALTDGLLREVLGRYGIEVVQSVQHAEAVLATKDVSSLLDIPIRTPLLHTTITESTFGNKPVEYQENWVYVERMPYWLRIDWTGAANREL